jgi:hypothetical protein
VEEHITFIADVRGANSVDTIHNNKGKEYYKFDSDKIEERLIYYDCLADSGATSHITHRRDAFTTYQHIPEIPIARVGKLKAHAIG